MNISSISTRNVATHLTKLRRVNARLAGTVRRLTRDISQARHFATHDSLTGLPNRRLLLDRIGQALAHATRYRKRVMVLVIDLDGFKVVNDVYGHSVGDELLRQVAGRLLACVRFCDTVCRYGGDEFVVMLPQIDAAEDAEVVSRKIRARLATPYVLGNEPHRVTASIGVAVYREDGQTSRELIDRADAAM
ncbi:MAG: diguanylate cyclase domain-containing protein, partial [Steroidobacteraceae bacterium]